MFNLCKKYKLILTNGKSGLLNIVNKKQNLAVSRSLCCSTAYRNVEHFENLPNGISVTFENKAKHKYHFAWLRDHCRCEKCYNVTTNQREVENVMVMRSEVHFTPEIEKQISYDIKPKQIQNIDGYLQVTWLDDHISKFDGSWLQQHRYGQQYSSSIVNGIERYFWDGSLKDKMPPTVDYTKVTNDSEEVLSLLQTIGKYGFGFVSGTPTTKEAMENICRMIGPVRETVYGGVDEFCNIPVDEMEHFDTAYLSIALNGHTDGTYFIDTPGLQLFHCHQHSGGVGGETLLVDGIGAAYKLKEIDPESFEFLCTTSVPAHYHKPGFITQVLNTIIRIDASSKEIYQVRINNYDRDVLTCLSYEDVERFYKALHSYMSILKDPQNELWFKLTPGNVILINNWRVLHGRSSFTGSRTICYGYVGIDDFLGKLRGQTTFSIKMGINIAQANQNVLFVWGSAAPPSDMECCIGSIKEQVGGGGKVQVENATILTKSGHENSIFDVAISGTNLSPFAHSDGLLAEILRILKPNGSLVIKESKSDRSADKLKSMLTLAGFTKIVKVENDSDSFIEMKCQKPNFEVGKSSKLPLSFSKKSTNPDVAKVWTLSLDDMNDDDVDIIDSDALLDADDLKRPDLTEIKTDCGTSKGGKRKACKGCTCGLKEELENGSTAPVQEKSACGSCNLGDAFRCASCPYLGMPPFKPGEQITLSDRQLNPDK